MPLCFDCRFFAPNSDRVLEAQDRDETLAGECRFHQPQVGDLMNANIDDQERWFGEFPHVMASDWCGSFEPRQRESEFVTTFIV